MSFRRKSKGNGNGNSKGNGKRKRKSQPNSHFYANSELANTICNFSLQAVSQVNGSQHSWSLKTR
ncbi:uncharacterized protein Dyak_GE28274 [Drosophila yakuba]|uniref:Uncharacterized protein n=1 Tax=Drosophila yakuba TaxID=7245 RepID=A0A0R1DWD0_DROYA|nr:uncharacterized protein Dyak_GE28274 [Drosophila yakuba]